LPKLVSARARKFEFRMIFQYEFAAMIGDLATTGYHHRATVKENGSNFARLPVLCCMGITDDQAGSEMA
jgi:hypothetical protein